MDEFFSFFFLLLFIFFLRGTVSNRTPPGTCSMVVKGIDEIKEPRRQERRCVCV